ncbi:winged helix-turn-helix transcriptional regulator [Phytoactinopolyspora alkaliphila]|uniref:Winged helix-turn-helix transcriptional regulator n=1 Tax=Phytoactinopolyspora alkaliphila TaxID=1783498 RepID=A0A6N9YIH7_9ACTN|nr:TrmB family transcriptional regulator [Phytoactinopolyspora alkaliphila]NED94708.1 winged helix-turn-helix transcriptional regulator [Phytoactinopolyspora alkaliphila]
MLEALGISEQDEELYRAVLRRPHATADELAERAGHATATIRRGLRRLEDLGLLARLAGQPTRFMAIRPDVAVDVLVSRRQQELAQAQVAARALVSEMVTDRPQDPEELVEIVSGRRAVAHRFLQMEQVVSDELLVLDRPPYAYSPGVPNRHELELLARGVRCRGIYAPDGLELPGRMRELRTLVEAGEEARTSSVVPMKLAIADRSVAILPLNSEQVTEQALVVHASTLVDALVSLFEMLWVRSLPLTWDVSDSSATSAGTSNAAQPPQELLNLLAAGLSDTAIARQLEVSPRTLSRQLAVLTRLLGARTRFQAGVRARQEGLV